MEFHADVTTYFNYVDSTSIARRYASGGPVQEVSGEEGKKARSRINFSMQEVQEIVYTAVGGRKVTVSGVGTVDVLDNLFTLDTVPIPHSEVTDILEQAIGVYESDRKASFRRTVNPL